MAVASERVLVLRVEEKRQGNALVSAARDLDKLSHGADTAGDSMAGMERDAKHLEVQIARTKERIRDLGQQFARTGDESLFGDMRRERSFLTNLERTAQSLAPQVQKSFIKQLDFSETVAEARGMLIAGGAALGLAMAPALAGVLSSAVVGAVGAGGVVGGAVLAAQDTRVQAAWKNLGTSIMGQLEPAGAAFVEPVILAADTLKGSFERSGLVDTLKEATVLVGPLTEAFGGFIEELGPGLEAAVKGSLPTWRMFARELPEFGAAFSDVLESMSEVGPEAAVAMGDLFNVLEDGMRSAGPAIEGLTRVYVLTRGLNESLKIKGGSIFGDFIPTFGMLEVIGKLFGDTAKKEEGVADATDELRRKQEEATASVDDFVRAMKAENDEFERHIDLQATVKLDMIDLEEGLQDLADTLDENGNSLSSNTDEGRENQRAIINLAKEIRQLRDDQIAMGQTTESANAVLETNRQRLYDQAAAAGISKQRVDELVGSLLSVPTINTVGPIVTRPLDPNTGEPIGRRAAGGRTAPYGTYWVGEKGPELLTMGGQSGYVMSNAQSFGSPSVNISFAATGDPLLDVLIREFRRYIRIESGGDVQVALGQ